MRSILIILFLSIISPSALAESTKPKDDSVTARDAYKTSLLAERIDSGKSEADEKCWEAKRAFRSAERELIRIKGELAIPANDTLGKAQADYRADLETIKQAKEAQIAKAKTDAEAAGTELAAAKAKIEAIESEINRIETLERLEREAAGQPASRSGLGSLNDGDNFSEEGLGRSVYEPNPDLPLLPKEFKGCFSNEVSS